MQFSTQAVEMRSQAFQEGGSIPPQYTCDGANLSPPLEWGAGPAETRTWALIADDPDAPRGTFTHWVLFNLPASIRSLPENVAGGKVLPNGARQGANDFKKIGYGGPCPPSGAHRYYFKLYALNTELELQAGATRQDLLKAMEGHVVGQGQLMGTYARRK